VYLSGGREIDWTFRGWWSGRNLRFNAEETEKDQVEGRVSEKEIRMILEEESKQRMKSIEGPVGA